MSNVESLDSVLDEIINSMADQTGRIMVRQIQKAISDLVKDRRIPRKMGDKLTALFRSQGKENYIVALKDYPGLVALGRADVLPIEMELGQGRVVINGNAEPYLGIFKSFSEHRHLANLLESLDASLFNGGKTYSVQNVLNDRNNRLQGDFQELYQSRLRQLHGEVGARIREFLDMRYRIEDYGRQAANVLREYVIAANKVFDTLLAGVERLDHVGPSDKEAVARCSAMLLNIVGMLHHYLIVFNKGTAHEAENLNYKLLAAFKTYAQDLVNE